MLDVLISQLPPEAQGAFVGLLQTEGDVPKLPEGRATVGECLVAVLWEVLVGHYLAGGSKLATELDHLVAAVQNPDDPLMVGMDVVQRESMKSVLYQLHKRKERAHGQGKPALENPAR